MQKRKKLFLQISDGKEKRMKKNEIWKNAKSFFCEFRAIWVFGLKFEIRRKLRFAGFSIYFGVRKWIRIWKVTKPRPNMGLIAGTSLFTGANLGRWTGGHTLGALISAYSLRFAIRFWSDIWSPAQTDQKYQSMIGDFWNKKSCLPRSLGTSWVCDCSFLR